MNTVLKNSNAKSLIKKSQFYGYIYKIKSESEVKEIIHELKAKHKSANHVSYAYKIANVINDKVEYISRYDDDGEPSKTAGFPLQQIIEQKKLSNVLIAVARVFGGIKLGTAGLIKAYGNAGRESLEQTKITKLELTKELNIEISLSNYSKLEIYLKQKKLKFKSEFSQNVRVKVFIPLNDLLIEEEINHLLLHQHSTL